METPTVYVICDKNCKFEGMTKEQILTAIMQAVNEGTISNIDAGFVQTIKTINGVALKFFVGEQSAYDALSEADKENLFAIITNDTSTTELLAYLNGLGERVGVLEQRAQDSRVANADYATSAGSASTASKVSIGTITTVDEARGVWFSDSDIDGKPIIVSDKFNYNPITDTLTVGKINGKSSSAEKADGATRIVKDGCIFGKERLWTNDALIVNEDSAFIFTTTAKSLDLEKTLKGKRLIVEIEKYYKNTTLNLLQGEIVFDVNLFRILNEGSYFEQTIDGTTFYFTVEGTNLYFKASTSNRYGIVGIFEDIYEVE